LGLRLKQTFVLFTFIKIAAGISGHFLFLAETAMRA